MFHFFFCCFVAIVTSHSDEPIFWALFYLLDNIFIRFGSKLYRQIVGIPMSTNCAEIRYSTFCKLYYTHI